MGSAMRNGCRKLVCLVLICSLVYLNACATHQQRVVEAKKRADGYNQFSVSEGKEGISDIERQTQMQARTPGWEFEKHPASVAGCCLGTALIASAVFLVPKADESVRAPIWVAEAVVGGLIVLGLFMYGILSTSDSTY